MLKPQLTSAMSQNRNHAVIVVHRDSRSSSRQ